MEEKIRMAIMGTGSMGRQYAQMIDKGAVPHMELTAVCCRSDEACRWAAESLGGRAAVYRSADELCSHPELYDAVLIVTPHCSHEELAGKAFSLGKHVFCDKPLGLSVRLSCFISGSMKKIKGFVRLYREANWEKFRGFPW